MSVDLDDVVAIDAHTHAERNAGDGAPKNCWRALHEPHIYIDLNGWLQDSTEPPISDEVRPPVLRENGARLLGLKTS